MNIKNPVKKNFQKKNSMNSKGLEDDGGPEKAKIGVSKC